MMTHRQRDAIRAILDLQAARLRKCPTLADLARAMGHPSRGHAHDMILGLERRGLIRRDGPGLRVTVLPRALQVFAYDRDTGTMKPYK